MTTQKNKPAATIRDGSIKATIWANFGEKGTFYTVEISRTYKDDQGNYHDAHSFSGTQLLRVARVSHLAYTRISELRQQDASEAQDAPKAGSGQ